MVSELIDTSTSSWNVDMIKEFFPEAEANKILSIPLSRHDSFDRLFWPFSNTCMYTVKSGYMFLCQIIAQQEASSSGNMKEIWKWLWKLDVIPKVKLFLWKCLSDALATKVALRKRSISLDTRCQRCGEDDESIEHIFRNCAWARFFWMASPLRIQPSVEESCLPFSCWIRQIQKIDSKDYHRLFAILLWVMWFARNLLIYQGKELNHVQCFELAQKMMWRKEERRKTIKPGRNQTINNKNGFLKVKCDAAVKVNFGVCIGIVILNENNNVLACRYKCLPASMVVELAEGIAVREGLLFAKEITTNAKLILETDCQALHSKLISAASNLSFVGSIVDDIRRLAADLDGVEYSWTRRDENLIADQLAKYALDNL